MPSIRLTDLLVRFYANGLLAEDPPRPFCGGCVMLPKTTHRTVAFYIRRAEHAAKVEAFGEDRSAWPKISPERHALRDGDCEYWAGFEDHWYLAFRSPHVVEQALKGGSLTNGPSLPPFTMGEGVFEISAGNFDGFRVRCELVSLSL